MNYINISDDNDDVKFIKKTPLNPRERVKHLREKLRKNQTDKKIFPQILPQKTLIQKNKNQSKDIFASKCD